MSTIPPDELTAAVEARKELGPENEDAVVEAFLARIEREIDKCVDERVAATRRGHFARASVCNDRSTRRISDPRD